MHSSLNTQTSKKPDKLFDWECKVARKNVRRLLKKFRRSLHSEDRNSFCIAKREYKNMLKRKKVDFNAVLLDKSISSVKSQKDLWKTVHKISFKRKSVYNYISVDSWFQH